MSDDTNKERMNDHGSNDENINADISQTNDDFNDINDNQSKKKNDNNIDKVNGNDKNDLDGTQTTNSIDNNKHDDDDDDKNPKQSSKTPKQSNDFKWQTMYTELRTFISLHNHSRVPRNHTQLGRWVNNQRTQYKYVLNKKPSWLTPDRIQALNSVNFQWEVGLRDDISWNTRLEELKTYIQTFGHCHVPQSFSNKALAHWVSRQRKQYKKYLRKEKSLMTEERIRKLNEIGFVWHGCSSSSASSSSSFQRDDISWNSRLDELKQYMQTFGHCHVPLSFSNKALAHWVSRQRKQYQKYLRKEKSFLTDERIRKLNEIGFVWHGCSSSSAFSTSSSQRDPQIYNDLQIKCWNRGLELFRNFRTNEGHGHVPQNYVGELGIWAEAQRTHYQRLQLLYPPNQASQLTQERMRTLNELNFAWKSFPCDNIAWIKQYEALKKFKTDKGHCKVPCHYRDDPELGRWVMTQRKQYTYFRCNLKSALTQPMVQALEELGFVWKTSIRDEDAWRKRFEELKDYIRREGNCHVPRSYQTNPELGRWVNYQRKQYSYLKDNKKPSQLTPERIAAMETIGFQWQAGKQRDNHTWLKRYEELKTFKASKGHCNVPHVYAVNKPLGRWVGTQRAHYKYKMEGKKTIMNEERMRLLEEIGFRWKADSNVVKVARIDDTG